jgi:hypothetical protein
MKKLLLSIAMSAFIFTVNAQTFGVKTGLNFSNIDAEVTGFGSGSADGMTGFFIAGIVDFSISDKFHIQPELQYSIEGAKDADLNLINIPVMAKYYVAEGFNIQAGPQIGFIVDAEGGTEGLKTTNFGLNLGAGYDLAETGLFFDARYNLGLSDVTEVAGVEIKTKTFQIGIGYKF